MGFRRVGDGLGRAVTGWIDDPRLHEQVVHQAWERTCGPTLAAHARAVQVQDGVLTVAVEDRRWRAVILEMRETLLHRLREELGAGAVREVRLAPPGAQPPGEEPAPRR